MNNKKHAQKFVRPLSPIDSLINEAQRKLDLRTKTETIEIVGSNPSMICRIRKGELKPSSDFILKFYFTTGISIEDILRIGNIQKLI